MKKKLLSAILAFTITSSAIISLNSTADYRAGTTSDNDFSKYYVEHFENAEKLIPKMNAWIGDKFFENQFFCSSGFTRLWYRAKNKGFSTEFIGEVKIKDYANIDVTAYEGDESPKDFLDEHLGYEDIVKVTAKSSGNAGVRIVLDSVDTELNYMIVEKAVSLLKSSGYECSDVNLSFDKYMYEEFHFHKPQIPISDTDAWKKMSPEERDEYNKLMEENGFRVRYYTVDPEPVDIANIKFTYYAIYPDDFTAEEMLDYVTFIRSEFGRSTETEFLADMKMSEGLDITLEEFEANNSYVHGDANNDGKTTIADATAVLQSIVNPTKYSLTDQGVFNADFAGDGLTPEDALEIQRLNSLG